MRLLYALKDNRGKLDQDTQLVEWPFYPAKL